MTKPVTRAMAVNCLLDRVIRQFGAPLLSPADGEPLLPGQPIQFDHIHADVHGGPHEYQNLRPIHVEAHKKKTKADVQAVAKRDRIDQKRNRPRRQRTLTPDLVSRPSPRCTKCGEPKDCCACPPKPARQSFGRRK